MTKVTRNDLLEAIRQYGKASPKHPAGEGWVTLDALAAQEGISKGMLRYRLEQAMKRGVKIETATGSAEDADGKMRRVMYYRLFKNGKP